jgi:hypothetical protein
MKGSGSREQESGLTQEAGVRHQDSERAGFVMQPGVYMLEAAL